MGFNEDDRIRSKNAQFNTPKGGKLPFSIDILRFDSGKYLLRIDNNDIGYYDGPHQALDAAAIELGFYKS